MGFLNKDNLSHLVEKLSDSSNIKINDNPHGNRVSTVVEKIVEKADEVTKSINQLVVNNRYSFKFGTGDVDVSSDVEDGFGEIGLKGVTYHSVLNDFTISHPSMISYDGGRIKWNKNNTSSSICINYNDAVIEPNKKYTLIFHIYKNTLKRTTPPSDNYSVCKFNFVNYNSGVYRINNGDIGLVKVVVEQPNESTHDGKPYLEVFDDCTGILEISYPVLLIGDQTKNDIPLSYFDGIVGIGDKSNNLFNFKTTSVHLGRLWNGNLETGYVADLSENKGKYSYTITGSSIRGITFKNILTKLKGKYTLSFIQDSAGNPFYNINLIKDGKFIKQIGDNSSVNKLNGINYITFDTGNVDFDEIYFTIGVTNPPTIPLKVNISNIQLKYKNSNLLYEPYYDGYKIEFLSKQRCVTHSEYLDHVKSFNINNIKCEEYLGMLRFTEMGGYYERDFNNLRTLQLTPNTVYTLKLKIDFDTTANYIISGGLDKKKISNNHYEFLTDSTGLVAIYPFSVGQGFTNVLFDIIIEPKQGFSESKADIELKTQLFLDEPLMKLPNGVYDELTFNGGLVRRIGRYTFTGKEDGWYMESGKQTRRFRVGVSNIGIKKAKKLNAIGYCNKIPVVPNSDYNKDKQLIEDDATNISIRSPLSTLEEFKTWLSNNPVTIYYELSETDEKETIPPSVRIFKDGYLKLNTLVAPESTHLVQLNKSAQIERNIKEVQRLNSKVEKLESFYDDMILETSYKLDLLNYDFKYTKERNNE